jgi:hypothetical protein
MDMVELMPRDENISGMFVRICGELFVWLIPCMLHGDEVQIVVQQGALYTHGFSCHLSAIILKLYEQSTKKFKVPRLIQLDVKAVD